jgi:hypothetical protein
VGAGRGVEGASGRLDDSQPELGARGTQAFIGIRSFLQTFPRSCMGPPKVSWLSAVFLRPEILIYLPPTTTGI